jgi:hypothetical protein
MIKSKTTELGDGIMAGAGKGYMVRNGQLFTYDGDNYSVQGIIADRLDKKSLIYVIEQGAIIGHDNEGKMVLIKSIDRPNVDSQYNHAFISMNA